MNKEEFIEKYKLHSAQGMGNALFDRSEEMRKDLDLLSDLSESKGDGWIPVTEKLPEDKTACLTCFKGSLVDFEMYLDGEFENGDDPNRTHWQPLPQPPQGEKGETKW